MDKIIQKELVITKHKENVNWIKDVNSDWKITIYDKELSLDLPNIGRESHTNLYHICLNYYNLAEITVFTQGNPFDHCKTFVNKVNTLDRLKGFLPLSDERLTITNDWNLFTPPQRISTYQKRFDLPIKSISFPYGALFAISKETILKKPLKYYLNWLTYISHEVDNCRMMEYFWEEIFK